MNWAIRNPSLHHVSTFVLTRKYGFTPRYQDQAGAALDPQVEANWAPELYERTTSGPEVISELTSAPQAVPQAGEKALGAPVYHVGSKFVREPYWQQIPRWKHISEVQFLTHSWQVSHSYRLA